jgi:hypothetical protein
MGWTPGADALHAWYMYAAENKDILRLAFELGMDGNTSMYIASIGYTWVPKVAYNLIMDYWGVIEGDSPVFKLYMKHGLDPNRPFSPQRLNLFMMLGWISNDGAMFTHMLENCPDPDEALAYRARYLGTVEVGARLLHNNAIVDAIEDYRRKRLENQETTSGTKS